MKNKFLISSLMLLILTITVSSCSFATNINNMMDSTRNAVNNAESVIENSAIKTKDTIVNGAENLASGAETLGNDTMNMMGNNNATDGNGTMVGMDNDTNYIATRTATDTTGGFLGMSNDLTTWIILGLVGAIIVGLIWYYNAQYEHKNYNND